jgi:hypothetical protein
VEAATSSAARLEHLATETIAVHARIEAGLRNYIVGHRWRGPGSAAALNMVDRRVSALRRLGADLGAAARRVRDGTARMGRIQAGLRTSVDRVRSDERLAYEPTGRVTVRWRAALPALAFGTLDTIEVARLELLAGHLGTDICGAVAEADRLDRACADSLESLTAGARAILRTDDPEQLRADWAADLGPAAFVAWLSAVPATDAAPQDVADWWAAHTAAEKITLSGDTMLAGRLGSLDGLPTDVRDRVNRGALARRCAAFAAALAQVEASLARAEPAAFGPIVRERSLLLAEHRVDLRVAEQLRALDGWLDPVTGKALRGELLLDQPDRWGGKGRVSIAIGRVDGAAHVAYVVPGLGVRADPDLPGLVSSAHNIYAEARRLAPETAVAVVAWLGYDTPRWTDVAFDARARAGAALFARDIDGLRAGRSDHPPHLTVIGHSYGSTTASLGIRRAVAHVDDAVFVGSPGVEAERAADLPVPARHVWVGAASGDEVSRLSRFGVDPAAAVFGGHRFPAESPSGTSPVAQHTRYFEPGSQSLLNVARIVVGQGTRVPVAPGRVDAGILGEIEHVTVPIVAFPVLSLPAVLPLLTLDPTFGDPAHG